MTKTEFDCELSQLVSDMKLIDENHCLERMSETQLRTIAKYFYLLGGLNGGKLE